jgi:hypothetical protein
VFYKPLLPVCSPELRSSRDERILDAAAIDAVKAYCRDERLDATAINPREGVRRRGLARLLRIRWR